MSTSVWKFPVQIADEQTITMPEGATLLSFQEQYGRPTLWALVDPDAVISEDRTFRLAGTGHPLPEDPGEFVGTIITMGGALVWHLFEVKP